MTKQILAGRKSRKMTMAVSVAALAIAAYAAPQTGVMTDSRDGKTYKTVKIGSQTWMAENLNYETEYSYCYNNEMHSCKKYGRLYEWEAALRACPDGWHLPTKAEFEKLFDAVGGHKKAGKMLKSISGWKDDGNGSDTFGFNALPVGFQQFANSSVARSAGALFWGSTRIRGFSSIVIALYYNYDGVVLGGDALPSVDNYAVDAVHNAGFAVRCLQDSALNNAEGPHRSSNAPELVKGVMTDKRDGQTYKTVKIGTQTWMAENLNYKVKESWCYHNIEDNCSWYGRLYKWQIARNICPSGWHLPTIAEFEMLFDAVGGVKIAGKMLKSTIAWENDANGTDAFGFTALPAGMHSSEEGDFFRGQGAVFWSSTEKSFKEAGYMILRHEDGDLGILDYIDKIASFSVRCVKD